VKAVISLGMKFILLAIYILFQNEYIVEQIRALA
jgi:type IV secretory pathway TrbL component